jgi:hypothetical protein
VDMRPAGADAGPTRVDVGHVHMEAEFFLIFNFFSMSMRTHSCVCEDPSASAWIQAHPHECGDLSTR